MFKRLENIFSTCTMFKGLEHISKFATKKTLTQEVIIEGIRSGEIFGLALVNIKTPDHLKEYFGELQPIFKNVEVSINNGGPVRVRQNPGNRSGSKSYSLQVILEKKSCFQHPC